MNLKSNWPATAQELVGLKILRGRRWCTLTLALLIWWWQSKQVPPYIKRNERILSCMDLLTHYLFLVPIKDKQAETIISAYTENIYTEAGGSHTILSDRGSEFTAKTFREITKELGLRQVFTSPRTLTLPLSRTWSIFTHSARPVRI